MRRPQKWSAAEVALHRGQSGGEVFYRVHGRRRQGHGIGGVQLLDRELTFPRLSQVTTKIATAVVLPRFSVQTNRDQHEQHQSVSFQTRGASWSGAVLTLPFSNNLPCLSILAGTTAGSAPAKPETDAATYRGNWHGTKCCFGFHHDLHVLKSDSDIGTQCNPKELAQMLKLTGADFVQTDSKGHPGLTSWFSKTPGASVGPGVVKDALLARAATKRNSACRCTATIPASTTCRPAPSIPNGALWGGWKTRQRGRFGHGKCGRRQDVSA